MADAPPPGPPPPKVPEGWKAVWDTKYSEWYYVNRFTKASQWEKPTEPAIDPNSHSEAPPSGAPPAYIPQSGTTTVGEEKHNPNNPYSQPNIRASQEDADAKYAAKLQAEENARIPSTGAGTRGASDSYYGSDTNAGSGVVGYQAQQQYSNTSSTPSRYPSGQVDTIPQSDGKRGFLSKILGKSSHPPTQQQYQQSGYGGGYGHQYPPQGQYYGQGYPPQQMGGTMFGGPGSQYQSGPPKRSGGLGAGGGMMLGAGAGLVGGAMLMNAVDDHNDFEEQQAYQQGQDDGYDQGMDSGGGDMGGGDF